MKKSAPALAAERLRAGQKCSQLVFCRFATDETGPYDRSGFLACGLTRLLRPTRGAAVAMISPCFDSIGSGRRASDRPHHVQFLRPPIASMGEWRVHLYGRARGILQVPEADLGVVQSTLREERARRALRFSKAGRLLAIEILESVLQGCFGCDDHASRFRHQLRI